MPSDALREAISDALPCLCGGIPRGGAGHFSTCPAESREDLIAAVAPLFEALERDRERLDRFERARWMFKVTARGNAVTVAHGGTREQGYHPSLRAAIDAARATEADDGK